MADDATMTAHARIARLAAATGLPEITHGTSYRQPDLKVHGKSFASIKAPATMVLHCPLEQKELLMEMSPEVYWQTDHYRGWPAILVHLDVIGDEELQLRLADAWRFRAPRRLAAAHPAGTD